MPIAYLGKLDKNPTIMQIGVTVAYEVHTLVVVGSTPASASITSLRKSSDSEMKTQSALKNLDQCIQCVRTRLLAMHAVYDEYNP